MLHQNMYIHIYKSVNFFHKPTPFLRSLIMKMLSYDNYECNYMHIPKGFKEKNSH